MGGDPLFLVEKLVGVRRNRKSGQREFKVRWLDYAPKYDSWVSEPDLDGEAETFVLSKKVAKALKTSRKPPPPPPPPPPPKRGRGRPRKKTPESDTGSTEGDNVVKEDNGDEGQVEVSDSDWKGSKIESDVENAIQSFEERVPKRRRSTRGGKSVEKKVSEGIRRSGRLKSPKKRAVDELQSTAKSAPRKKQKPATEANSKKDYNEFWAVERILRMRKREGNRELKVRWKGFSWRFDAWVGEDDLLEPLMEFPMSPLLRKKIKQDMSN